MAKSKVKWRKPNEELPDPDRDYGKSRIVALVYLRTWDSSQLQTLEQDIHTGEWEDINCVWQLEDVIVWAWEEEVLSALGLPKVPH